MLRQEKMAFGLVHKITEQPEASKGTIRLLSVEEAESVTGGEGWSCSWHDGDGWDCNSNSGCGNSGCGIPSWFSPFSWM